MPGSRSPLCSPPEMAMRRFLEPQQKTVEKIWSDFLTWCRAGAMPAHLRQPASSAGPAELPYTGPLASPPAVPMYHPPVFNPAVFATAQPANAGPPAAAATPGTRAISSCWEILLCHLNRSNLAMFFAFDYW